MWAECVCGHGPHRATHHWDARRHRYTSCHVCVQCNRPDRDHGPFGHTFVRCHCTEYQEAS